MAKTDSSVFKLGFNKVSRRVVIPRIKAAQVFDVPAGMFIRRVYAENRSTTAVNLTVGNAAAGAQYLASTAVPVAVGGVPGVLYPQETLKTALPANPGTDTNVHITLSAYPVDNAALPAARQKGMVSVVIEYEELYGSLDIPSQHSPRAY